MNKTKEEEYREVLRDVSENFEGEEKFIKQRLRKCQNARKYLLKWHFRFIYFLCF